MQKIRNIYFIAILAIISNPVFAGGADSKINSALSQITSMLTAVAGSVGILAITWGAINYMGFKNPISDVVKRVAIGGLLIAAASQLVNLFLGSGSSSLGF